MRLNVSRQALRHGRSDRSSVAKLFRSSSGVDATELWFEEVVVAHYLRRDGGATRQHREAGPGLTWAADLPCFLPIAATNGPSTSSLSGPPAAVWQGPQSEENAS